MPVFVAGALGKGVRACFAFAFLVVFSAIIAVPAHAGPVEDASDFLAAIQRADGAVAGESDIATAFQSTSEALPLLQSGSPEHEAGLAYLGSYSGDNHSTEYLARRAVASGGDSALNEILLARQNRDGGFGAMPGTPSNILDTTFALEALGRVTSTDTLHTGQAAGFLLGSQGGNGSWADNSYLTARAMLALLPHRQDFPGVSTALSAATDYLLTTAAIDETFTDALSLLVLSRSSTDPSLYAGRADNLLASQEPDGSWDGGDAYVTALAAQALQAFEARRLGIDPDSSKGAVSGRIIGEGTGAPVTNARVTLVSDSGLAVETDADGYFVLRSVPAGMQTIVAQADGMTPASASVEITSGRLAGTGDIVLGIDADTAILSGVVLDGLAGTALAGATITLSGNGSVSGMTVADGTTMFAGLEPGEYSVTVDADGYRSEAFPVSLAGGEVRSIHQLLLPDDAYSGDDPVDLSMRAVDAGNGAPLASAVVSINGASHVADENGIITIPSLAPQAYEAGLSADGYSTRQLSFSLPAGSSSNFGDVALYSANGPEAPETLNLHLEIISSLDGSPVPGAMVHVRETGDSHTADANGRVAIDGLDRLDLNLDVAADGFAPATAEIVAPAFGSFSKSTLLAPLGADTDRSFSVVSGIVTDAESDEPIESATIRLRESDLVVTTDASGHFMLEPIETLEFSIEASAVGYSPKTLQSIVATHGDFSLDISLESNADDSPVQITRMNVLGEPEPGVLEGEAQIANPGNEAIEVALDVEVMDASDELVGTATAFDPSSGATLSTVSIPPGSTMQLHWRWDAGLTAPGTYQIHLRASEPGSYSRTRPYGIVLAEATATGSPAARAEISGAVRATPPIMQVGAETPIQFDAVVVNSGNTDLNGTPLLFTVRNEESGELVHSSETSLGNALPGSHTQFELGSWLPQEPGNFALSITPQSASVSGSVSGEVYVGDRPQAEFTVSPNKVLPGDQLTRAALQLNGIDVPEGESADPMSAAIQQAVQRGVDYLMPETRAWVRRNDCLGCHIQTQALVGLEGARRFIDVPEADDVFLRNSINGALKPDGGVSNSDTGGSSVESGLALWALSSLETLGEADRTLVEAAELLLRHGVRNDGTVYWNVDRDNGWWRFDSSVTAMVVKGMVRAVQEIEDGGVRIETAEAVHRYDAGGVTRVWDLYRDPDDDTLYVPSTQRKVSRLDPDTGTLEVIVKSLPSPVMSTVPDDNGGYYVGTSGGTIYVSSTGSRTRLSRRGAATLRPAPGGGVYVTERSSGSVSRLQIGKPPQEIVRGAPFQDPYGLHVEADGRLIVTDYRTHGIYRIDPATGDVSVVAEGLPFRPLHVVARDGGYVISVSDQHRGGGDGLYHLDPDSGRIRSVGHLGGISGITVTEDNRLLAVQNFEAQIYEMQPTARNVTDAQPFRDDVRAAARWALANHDAAVSRMRVADPAGMLMILAEAAKLETDPALLAEYQQAIDELEARIRELQYPNGGWAWDPNWKNEADALNTAFVGLALEYTDPSRDDPVLRSAVEFLLDHQLPDGSWESANRLLNSRLSATGLVMSYLPDALTRFGGIDVDLHLRVDDTRWIEAPNIAATTTQQGPEDTTDHVWEFRGVTSDGRRLEFDSFMPSLQIGEERPVALEGWLEFRNSFNDDIVRVDLDIPSVKAVSGLAVEVATEHGEYGANEPVDISGSVANLKPVEESGHVTLDVRAQGAEEVLAHVGDAALSTIPGEDSVSYAASWNTGTTLPGDFELHATLYNQDGEVADQSVATFRIVGPVSTIEAGVTTDRPVYGGFDSVRIDNRVRNITSNSPQRSMRGMLTVTDPEGAEILSRTLDIPAIAPSGLVDLPDGLVLNDAPAGEYAIVLQVQDAISREPLASASTAFKVERHPGDALAGSVSAGQSWVYQGDANTCVDTVTNRGSTLLESVDVIRQVVSLEDGSLVNESNITLTLQPETSDLRSRGIDTDGFAVGGYGCRLLADVGTGPTQLAAAGFGVVEPPIRIEAAMATGEQGRILILLDPACADSNPPEAPGNACDADPFGPELAPPLPIQREHLEAVLEEAGWNATIVTSAADFETEFASRGYELYALFSEQVKLPETLQHDVVADIEAGRGLLVAGNHDRRNGRLEEALGIKSLGRVIGKNLDTDTLRLAPSEIHPGGDIDFVIAHAPNAIREEGAETLAEYILEQKGNKTPDPESAITRNATGNGTGIYASFDWPVQSAAMGDDGELATLLDATLDAAHPAPYTAIAGRVYPLRIQLVNEGMATPGEIHLVLPEGASLVESPQSHAIDGNVIRWPFALAEDQVLEFEAWIRLPESTGNADFNAVIYSGEADDLTEQATSSLIIEVHPAG